MQLFVPAPSHKLRPSWGMSLRRLAVTRTAVGFTVGEALVWFGFVVMWPTILGSIYFFSGLFASGQVMPVRSFIINSAIVAVVKAIVIIPFWNLFFVQMNKVSLLKRSLLHLPFGFLYAAIVVTIVHQVKTNFLGDDYGQKAVLSDVYNLLSSYFMNFLVFHAYNFWLHNQRQHKKEQELRELAFQSEINALKTQIEPHFLFNTLNSISATVPPELEKTRVLIAQLADTFRYALRVNESQLVSLGDELDFLKTWLALEQHRFGKRLQVNYDIDPQTLSTRVPPMLLQPLVENALNHGVAHRVEGGTVTIECKMKSSETVCIAVRDTGVGYAGELAQMMNKGVGLRNIAKRLQLLYNETIHAERQPQGLCFSFQLPFNTGE
jgi:two-component system, LytTR family, sensor kinase